MARSSTGTARPNGLALTLQATTALIELVAVAVAAAWSDAVADASPFGRQGTIALAMALAVVTLAGAVAARIGTSGTVRVIVAVVVSAGAGVIALMALFFLIGGSTTIIFAFLLAHAALFVALIARAALRAPTRTKG